jgi:hypothetical protein
MFPTQIRLKFITRKIYFYSAFLINKVDSIQIFIIKVKIQNKVLLMLLKNKIKLSNKS